MACNEGEFTIAEMIGKNAVSADEIPVGEITKIIDQPDGSNDDPNKICDIKTDLFQIVVKLSPEVFPVLNEPTEILFSSQTLEKVVSSGIQLKLTKDMIASYLK
ncbi:MAG: hypothetical protein FK734_19135 [Asgard group archaeon]|nr:hypothetical protein [Asgard group archaeon]